MPVAHKRDNVPHRGRASGKPALQALIHDYIEDLEIDGRSALTAKRYAAYLATFAEWLAFRGARTVETLTTGDISDERLREYRLYLSRRRDPQSGRPIGPGTRNLYVIVLRNLIRYCRRRHLAVPDPDESLQLAKERDVEIRHLGRGEVERLLAAVDLSSEAGIRDRAILEVLFGTGVRVSELASLTVRQVDLGQRAAEVVGKGGRSRLILFTDRAADWLRRYLETRTDDHPALFIALRHRQPKPLSVRQIQRIVDDTSQRAGLPFHVSPHWLRHTRLTILATHSGVQAAQRVAGHSSLATTSRYLHVSDPHLRELFDAAEHADSGGP